MALEDLEVNVGGTSIKGVWIAIVLTFGSTIGGGIWAASQFFANVTVLGHGWCDKTLTRVGGATSNRLNTVSKGITNALTRVDQIVNLRRVCLSGNDR